MSLKERWEITDALEVLVLGSLVPVVSSQLQYHISTGSSGRSHHSDVRIERSGDNLASFHRI
jgi:hypothetical protein